MDTRAGLRRLGRRIQAERGKNGHPAAADLARAAGLSVRTVEIIEAGTHTGYPRPTTLAKIEGAFNWAPGSCDRVVAGGQPRYLPDPLMERIIATWTRLTAEQQLHLTRLAESFARGQRP